MKKTILKEIKEVNKIAGTQMTKAQEISFIKNRLNELSISLKEMDFRNQAAFDSYQKQHTLRPDTKVTIAGKATTAAQAQGKSSQLAKGTSVFGGDTVEYEGNKYKIGSFDSEANLVYLNTLDGKPAEDSKGNYLKVHKSKVKSSKSSQSTPKEARKGNPSVNKDAKKNAESFGITPQKLGNDGYKKAMYQAAVEALTDANFHDEARELISKIEGKPEWAKRVDYPKMDDPKYKEKMADIRKNGVDSSEYWGGEDGTHEFARKVASASGWDGVDAADGIAFTLKMNGFHKEADMIQSVFDDKPYMKEHSTNLSQMLPKNIK
jgi:hypothetical protein